MEGSSANSTLQEMETLRAKLYSVAKGKKEKFNTTEICEVSRQLDQLIIKHMNAAPMPAYKLQIIQGQSTHGSGFFVIYFLVIPSNQVQMI